MSRPVNEFRTTSREAFDKFIENNPSVDLCYDNYKKIIYTYNSLLVKYMIETGLKIRMPYGLGEIVVNKYKPKRYKINKTTGREVVNLAVDWQESRKIGKKVYLLNAHTEGYKFYFMWNWWKTRIKMAFIWKFEMARVNSRLLASKIKLPNSKYKDIYKEYPRKR